MQSDLTEVWARIAARTHEAATTGIKVCLCGPDDDCATACMQSNYRWKLKEHWSGETATFKAAGFDAWVRDWDGDYSSWVVKFRGKEIGAGDCHGGDDFRDGIICAEIVIRWTARKLYRRARVQKSSEIANTGGTADG